MKSAKTKIYVLLGIFLCSAAMMFFYQTTASATDTDNDPASIRTEAKPETRCGWFSNPTPANAWLLDKNGEWLIGAQGGFQAEGDWADFKDDQWVKTNGNYGYGCACMKVTTDKKKRRILTIQNAVARPLSACRADKKLKEPR